MRMVRKGSAYYVAWARPIRPLSSTPVYDWLFAAADVCLTDTSAIAAYADRFDTTKLVGSIFHISRCGSTALANAFRAIEGTLVISEARALSSILLPPRYGGINAPAEVKEALAVGFLGAVLKEFPAARIIIKFPSLMSIDIDGALRLLPRQRWCFMSRRPAEVIRSLERSPGGWLSNERALRNVRRMFNIPESADKDLERPRVHAYLLEQYLRSALHTRADAVAFLDYSNFSYRSVIKVVRYLLQVELGWSELRKIARSLRFYSKSVEERPFLPDRPLTLPSGYTNLDDLYRVYLRRLER
jgi:hypothetical protein